jgi:uncharacterized protein
MNRVTHFEIPATNPEKIAAFYTAVFNWKITKWPGPMDYWMISTGDGFGIDGGFMPRREPSPGCVNTISVENVDASIQSVEKNGGTIVFPKTAIPTIGWLAYAKDPEGTIFGMMQNDPIAK